MLICKRCGILSAYQCNVAANVNSSSLDKNAADTAYLAEAAEGLQCNAMPGRLLALCINQKITESCAWLLSTGGLQRNLLTGV